MTGKRIKCKYCDAIIKDIDHYASHLEKSHSEMIPPDMVPMQFIYYLRTNKTHGDCIICHKPTKWNEKTNKYHRFCDNPKCKEKYNRKISGVYKWMDRVHETQYTGTYELSFLIFLDTVMNFNPEDLIAPSPHTYYYEYDGEKHFYIPDFFIPSLNLEIEIKEGTNMHPKNLAVDKVKEKLKDEVMKSNSSSFNYLKIVEKENIKFLKYLELAKEKFVNNDNSAIFMV